MPELPEVNRLVDRLLEVALKKRVFQVEISDDPKVFRQVGGEQFVQEIMSRTITGINRRGSVIYIDLDGDGGTPVLELGRDAMFELRGQPPWTTCAWKKAPQPSPRWPPIGMKFVLHLRSEEHRDEVLLAFVDHHRQSHIYLCAAPLDEPPISTLGSDPMINMHSFEKFEEILRRRASPMKSLLTDKTFLAGVGDWLADEVLYQARVHPEERSHRLSAEQMRRVHEQIVAVCTTAVQKADCSQYPEDWLFHYRMTGKRPKTKLLLPNGAPASVQISDKGDRRSAFVKELQVRSDLQQEFEYSSTITRKRKTDRDEESGSPAKRARVS